MFCSKCGQQLEEGTKFCNKCGAPQGAVPAVAAAPQEAGFLGTALKKTFATLGKKPFLLWGLSLMTTLLTVLISVFGIIPLIVIPVVLVLSAGMMCVYLDSYLGKEVSSEQLFVGFKNFPRVAGGMAWMFLWIIIWGLIPIAGPVFAIIKALSYSFTPYILLKEPDITANGALKKSMEMTKGYKGQMFLAFFLVQICVVIAMGIALLLSLIPFVGIVSGIVLFLLYLAAIAVLPLFYGVLQSAMYVEVKEKKNIQ